MPRTSASSRKSVKEDRKPKNQLVDLKTVDWDLFYWDEEAATRIIFFGETLIRHVKGKWAKQPVKFEDWQIDILRTFYGWKRREDNMRRFRTLYLEVPRKNGKSFLGSIIALYQLFSDREYGAEVYSAATDKRQAKIVFKTACDMLDFAPKLKKRSKKTREGISYDARKSIYVPLSAEAFTKDGLNPSAILFDELHAQPNDELYDVLRSGMGAREQPVEVYITTAGNNIYGIGYAVHDYALKVNSGILKDDTFLGVIYAADEKDDPFAEETWYKANPNLGKSISLAGMRAEAIKAKNSPRALNNFLCKYLNIWTRQGKTWIPWEKWSRAAVFHQERNFFGRKAFIAVDLSKRIDISALTTVFPEENGDMKSLHTFWMPEDQAELREKEDRVPYAQWHKDGHLRFTDGDVIDYEVIFEEIMRQCKLFDVQEVILDPWGSTALSTMLMNEGITPIEFRQGWRSMSPAMKDLEALIYKGKFFHPNNPCMNWMMDNIKIKIDESENIRPDKKKSTNRIDGPVSLIMAVGRCSAALSNDSIYNERDMQFL